MDALFSVTEGKRHDSRFRFITKAPNVLYLFDLRYWSFTRFKKIVEAKGKNSEFNTELRLVGILHEGKW